MIGKLLFFSVLVSIVWLVPMKQKYDAVSEMYDSSEQYVEAVFSVTRTHEVGITRGESVPRSSYVEGSINLISGQEFFKKEFFKDNKVYKIGQIKKAYPAGKKFKVYFNPKLKRSHNGHYLRVRPYTRSLRASLSEKKSRLQKMVFGPLLISMASLLLYILFKFYRKRA